MGVTTILYDKTSVLGLLRHIENVANPRYCYQLYDQKINFYANGPYLKDVARFYKPYYILQPEKFANPTLQVFIYVQPDARQKDNPITDMRVFLQESQAKPIGSGIDIFERPMTDIKVIMDREQHKIYIIGTDLAELNLQLRTFIRDQLFREIEKAHGSAVFHGAAVEKNGCAVIFMGARDAGKTSSLLLLVAEKKWNIVSFDRIKLQLTADSIQVTGLAARCNIHKIAIENTPFLSHLQAMMKISYDRENKILVPGEFLNQITSTSTTPYAQLCLLVLPQIRQDVAGVEQTLIQDRTKMRQILYENLMEGQPIDKHCYWFPYYSTPVDVIEKNVQTIVDKICDQINAIAIRATYANYIDAIKNEQIHFLNEIV